METNTVFRPDRISQELIDKLGIVNVNFVNNLKYEFVESKLKEFIFEGGNLNYVNFNLRQDNKGTIRFNLISSINGNFDWLDFEIFIHPVEGLVFTHSGKDIFGIIKDPDIVSFGGYDNYPYVTNIYEHILNKAEEFDLDILIFKDENEIYPDLASTDLHIGELYKAFKEKQS